MDNDVIGESKLEEIDLPQNEDYRVDLAARSTGVDMGYTSMSNREESYIKSTIKIFTEDITDGTGTITIELKTPVVARYVKVNSLHNNRDGEYIAENDSTLGLDQSTPPLPSTS